MRSIQFTSMQGKLALWTCLSIMILASSAFAADQVATQGLPAPQIIPATATCGKCGMYPSHYPKFQSQIIFNDDSMTPFDGCKCMFGFLLNMGLFDSAHSLQDVAVVWVRDFNTGAWLNGKKANYVVGSDVMGPMGKDLVPFHDQNTAMLFQKEHGGNIVAYNAVAMSTLKPLMGGMRMNGGNTMNMRHKMENQEHNDTKMNDHRNM